MNDRMEASHFTADTLDDLLRSVFKQILAAGGDIRPTKGSAKELAGVLLELSNPRARLSHTETRGKPFSCLGELLWYLAGSNDVSFITYYIEKYSEFADGPRVLGGYGPRLFNSEERSSQFHTVAALLTNKRDSRRAVVQLFDAQDIRLEHNSVPCTCSLQFMIRDDRLHLLTHMRSNDAFIGLPHDVFCFTMLQEIMARVLSVELGTYIHMVGSLHLYSKDIEKAEDFLGEGFQSTKRPMPDMPNGDPWDAISTVLQTESAIRTGQAVDETSLSGLAPYWMDLVRLLQVFGGAKRKDVNDISTLMEQMSSDVYDAYISDRLRRASGT